MEEKTISSNNFFTCRFFPPLLLVIVLFSGCWSSEEKVHKIFAVVAKVVEGDYHVETFLIDGEPPTDGMTRMPGEQVTVTVTFTRNRDLPDHRSNRPIRAFLVRELKENHIHVAGSHTIFYDQDLPNRPGKIKQTIHTTISLLSAAEAESTEKLGLGRYCKVIIAETGSEIVSHKIFIAKSVSGSSD